MSSTPIRLITFNIRYAATALASPLELPWPLRLPPLAAFLHSILTPTTLLLLQEATPPQLHDILHALNHPPSPSPTMPPSPSTASPSSLTWSYIGLTRGSFPDEANPILYPTQSFHLTRSATLWLSPTPDRPSRGWDAGLHRIVTVGELVPVGGGKSVVVMNTHLDHAGHRARLESVGVLSNVAREWGGGDGAVFLGGDFNSRPGGEVVRGMEAGGWREVVDLVEGGGRWKGEETYTTFGEAGERRGKIDYLFVRGGEVVVEGFEVLGNEAGGVLFSDHRAVVADVRVLG